MSIDIQTINPTTEENLESYTYMAEEQVIEITDKVASAQRGWGRKSLDERAEALRTLVGALENHQKELAELMTKEMGKPIGQSREEVELCMSIVKHTAEQGPKVLAREERSLQGGKRGLIEYAPQGVIYGIQPWNFPCYQVIRYAAACIMGGNGVLLKHAENVTGSALLIEKIFAASQLPQDIFRVLVIDHDASDRLIERDVIRGVTFTGSPGGGAKVATKAASCLKKTVMELGSNDAYVVLSDADVEKAVKQCVIGRTYNNGEVCVAAKRFVVADEVYDAFRDAFVQGMKAVKVGDPMDASVDMGPMARKDLLEKLEQQTKESVEKGAKVLCGGKRREGKGYYFEPTVLDNVKPGQPAYDDELFGPVASLIRAKDDEDCLRIANDSRFGLGGGIFSRDEDRAIELAAREFDTGMVFVNGYGLAVPNLPFGGVKDSGWGREHGGFGMREFVNAKTIQVLG